MMTISRTYRFEAAHVLPSVPRNHKCGRMHGHNWRVTVVISGRVDPDRGWLIDFGKIDDVWTGQIHREVDHRLLNEILGLENPTSENVAVWIYRRIDAAFGSMVPSGEWPVSACLLSVTVHENDDCSATYAP